MKYNLKPLWTAVFVAIILSCACSSDFDGKNGVKKIYYPDSEQLQQVAEYKDGKLNGELKQYYRNGKLKARQQFKNDKPTDTCFFYYDNGQLCDCQVMKDGKKEGCWRKFSKEGKLISEINFMNDQFHGESREYTYRTGRLLTKFNYVKGLKEGRQETYYSNGKPEYVTYYHNGSECIGTEEWTDKGHKINNDFKINIQEQNEVLMKGTLNFIITLENARPDDELYQVNPKDTGRAVTIWRVIPKRNNRYLIDYTIARNGFLMEEVKVAAVRKTAKGNKFIKTAKFVAAANNF